MQKVQASRACRRLTLTCSLGHKRQRRQRQTGGASVPSVSRGGTCSPRAERPGNRPLKGHPEGPGGWGAAHAHLAAVSLPSSTTQMGSTEAALGLGLCRSHRASEGRAHSPQPVPVTPVGTGLCLATSPSAILWGVPGGQAHRGPLFSVQHQRERVGLPESIPFSGNITAKICVSLQSVRISQNNWKLTWPGKISYNQAPCLAILLTPKCPSSQPRQLGLLHDKQPLSSQQLLPRSLACTGWPGSPSGTQSRTGLPTALRQHQEPVGLTAPGPAPRSNTPPSPGFPSPAMADRKRSPATYLEGGALRAETSGPPPPGDRQAQQGSCPAHQDIAAEAGGSWNLSSLSREHQMLRTAQRITATVNPGKGRREAGWHRRTKVGSQGACAFSPIPVVTSHMKDASNPCALTQLGSTLCRGAHNARASPVLEPDLQSSNPLL